MLIVSWTGSNFYFISFPFFLLSRTAHEGDDSSAEMLRRLQVHLAPAGRPHAGAARARVRRGAEVACEAVWRSADEKSTMQLKEQSMLPPFERRLLQRGRRPASQATRATGAVLRPGQRLAAGRSGGSAATGHVASLWSPPPARPARRCSQAAVWQNRQN